MPVNPPTYAQDPSGPDGGATGDSNLTSHMNDLAMRRTPPGKSSGANDDAPAEASHSDRSPLAAAHATPLEEAARLACDAAAANGQVRPAVVADRAITKERQKRESPDR